MGDEEQIALLATLQERLSNALACLTTLKRSVETYTDKLDMLCQDLYSMKQSTADKIADIEASLKVVATRLKKAWKITKCNKRYIETIGKQELWRKSNRSRLFWVIIGCVVAAAVPLAVDMVKILLQIVFGE